MKNPEYFKGLMAVKKEELIDDFRRRKEISEQDKDIKERMSRIGVTSAFQSIIESKFLNRHITPIYIETKNGRFQVGEKPHEHIVFGKNQIDLVISDHENEKISVKYLNDEYEVGFYKGQYDEGIRAQVLKDSIKPAIVEEKNVLETLAKLAVVYKNNSDFIEKEKGELVNFP